MMYDTCAVGAPGIWARGIRVFIEGIVAFALGGFLYVSLFSSRLGAGLTLNALSGFFFDRDLGVVCSRYTTPMRYYCRIHRKKVYQVQTSSGPVVQFRYASLPSGHRNKQTRQVRIKPTPYFGVLLPTLLVLCH